MTGKMIWYVLLLLFIAADLSESADSGELICQEGYTGLQSSSLCYRLATTPANYADARAACQKDGGDLASIHQAFENKFIQNLNTDTRMLIGLRFSSGPDFEWSDSSTLDYKNYVDGFEDNKDYFGYCTVLVGASGKWDNTYCDSELLPYVCKRAAQNYTETPNSLCPNSSTFYMDGGTILSPGYPKNYGLNMHCVYKLAAQTDFVIKLYLDDLNLYYGYDTILVVNKYYSDRKLLMLYKTETAGYEITFPSNRVALQFNSYNGGIAGTWMLSWTESRKLIVKTLAVETSHPFDAVDDDNYMCDTGYELSEEHCYHLETSKQLNYHDAVAFCREDGGDLVSIHSQHANEFLIKYIGNTEALIGLTYAENNTFQWSDGTPVDYTEYAEELLPMIGYLGRCVRLLSDKCWHNVECNDELSFICEKKAMNYTPTANNACPSASHMYHDSGVLISPGYPGLYAGVPGSCYYEILVKIPHNITLVVNEINIPANSYFNVEYYTNGNYYYAGVAQIYNENAGTEILIPHNRIRLTFVPTGSGRWRISYTATAK